MTQPRESGKAAAGDTHSHKKCKLGTWGARDHAQMVLVVSSHGPLMPRRVAPKCVMVVVRLETAPLDITN